MMQRPCFLVIDREYAGSISTRKLVVETAKFNVLTAYSAEEALNTFRRFPNVDGIVLDPDTQGEPCDKLVKGLREIQPNVPIVVVSSQALENCDDDEIYRVSSFDPKELLAQLQDIYPRESETLIKRDTYLRLSEMSDDQNIPSG